MVTQSELSEKFVNGATKGKSGTLEIHGNTLYNTESNYHAVARRELTDMGRVMIVENNGKYYLRNHSWQIELIEDALGEDGGHNIKEVFYESFESSREPKANCPVEDSEARLAGIKEELVSKAAFLEDPTLQGTPRAVEKSIARLTCLASILTADIRITSKEKQMWTFKTLTRLPEILETAIENGGIEKWKLQEVLDARQKAKDLMDEIDKHILVVMSIPTQADEHECKA